MLAEPMTLYKLMNLYMLHQVNFAADQRAALQFFAWIVSTPRISHSSRP